MIQRKTILSSLVILLIGILGMLVLEAYCRIDGRYRSYSESLGKGFTSPFDVGPRSWYNIPGPHQEINLPAPEFANKWRSNNESFKDIDFKKTHNNLRIITIGDSYTEGVGADNDSSFAKQLSYLLNTNPSRHVDVWNCGVSGADLLFEYKIFHDRLLKYSPDVLIVLYNSTDIGDVNTKGGFERFQRDSTLRFRNAPWFMPLYARSYLVRRIVHDMLHYDWLFIKPEEALLKKRETEQVLTAAADSLATLCRQKGIAILFAIHPLKGEFVDTSTYASDFLIRHCHSAHYHCVDVGSSLRSMGITPANAETIYWPQDGHCKNRGYYFFALAVLDSVKSLLPAQILN